MTLPTTFEVTLEFLSDWHVGTGQGRLGTVDAEVRRDADKLPFVPAKTLVGVWRDACETVADTFDRAASEPGAWRAWVTWLFGTQAGNADSPARAGGPPQPAALRLTPARAPDWMRTGVRSRPALAQAAVVLRPGVQIDDTTGTAADQLLRVEERAIRGLRLHTMVSVATGVTEDAGPLPAPAELLLRAGARLVEALGGKRNRGSGRLAFLLPDSQVTGVDGHPTVTDRRLAELLAAGVPAAPAAPPPARDLVTVYPYERMPASGRRVVRVALQVLTPVVAAEKVLGNVITSHTSIPGTALLGTILRRVAVAGSGDGDGRGQIGLNDLRVGDAVPAVIDRDDPASVVPAYPVPAVWQRGDKGRGATVYNSLDGKPESDARAKSMSGWIVADGPQWRPVSPAMTANTHAVVDDDARRPTVASGGVYTYVGIAAGTLLCSDIVLPAEAPLRLKEGEELRFGRSRKDDYGLVKVVKVIDLPPRPTPPALTAGTLRVWCVSDVLLRDERLAPDPSPRALARALSTALATPEVENPAATPPPVSVQVVPAETVASVIRREGFTVKWGRPRLSQVALRAGSVVTFTVTGEIDPVRLAEVEREGIGERTAEGFGRLRFNPPELAIARPPVQFSDLVESTAGKAAGGEAVERESIPVEKVGEQAHPLEVNAWRRELRRASAGLAPEDLVKGVDRLTGKRAQLGSLRAQLERLYLPGGTRMVESWLEGTGAVRARQEMWSQDVLDDLRKLLVSDRNLVWERLGLHKSQSHLVFAPGREAAVRDYLHTEAVVTSMTDALRALARTPAQPEAGTRHTEEMP
ncbi:RAMP superfamily CRISPR-associated protein [Micromonospora sp. RTGN7]|uniref:RAMP superfamily CRISPR-associated protein n=1 Tax=Micromonospora sp. RTGN7 TaxID=3016526 RepID=UPI0029FF0629|nr:RAMP superfamily CRISPR-associated protein [Micromonospora sp. RTGN7]